MGALFHLFYISNNLLAIILHFYQQAFLRISVLREVSTFRKLPTPVNMSRVHHEF